MWLCFILSCVDCHWVLNKHFNFKSILCKAQWLVFFIQMHFFCFTFSLSQSFYKMGGCKNLFFTLILSLSQAHYLFQNTPSMLSISWVLVTSLKMARTKFVIMKTHQTHPPHKVKPLTHPLLKPKTRERARKSTFLLGLILKLLWPSYFPEYA